MRHAGRYGSTVLMRRRRSQCILPFARIGPTEIRIAIGVINTILIFWNPVLMLWKNIHLKVADMGGLLLGLLFIITFIVYSIKGAIQLDRLDRSVLKNSI